MTRVTWNSINWYSNRIGNFVLYDLSGLKDSPLGNWFRSLLQTASLRFPPILPHPATATRRWCKTEGENQYFFISQDPWKSTQHVCCVKNNNKPFKKKAANENRARWVKLRRFCVAKPTKNETNLSMKLFTIRFLCNFSVWVEAENVLWWYRNSLKTENSFCMKSFCDASEKRKRRCGKTFCFRLSDEDWNHCCPTPQIFFLNYNRNNNAIRRSECLSFHN